MSTEANSLHSVSLAMLIDWGTKWPWMRFKWYITRYPQLVGILPIFKWSRVDSHYSLALRYSNLSERSKDRVSVSQKYDLALDRMIKSTRDTGTTIVMFLVTLPYVWVFHFRPGGISYHSLRNFHSWKPSLELNVLCDNTSATFQILIIIFHYAYIIRYLYTTLCTEWLPTQIWVSHHWLYYTSIVIVYCIYLLQSYHLLEFWTLLTHLEIPKVIGGPLYMTSKKKDVY